MTKKWVWLAGLAAVAMGSAPALAASGVGIGDPTATYNGEMTLPAEVMNGTDEYLVDLDGNTGLGNDFSTVSGYVDNILRYKNDSGLAAGDDLRFMLTNATWDETQTLALQLVEGEYGNPADVDGDGTPGETLPINIGAVTYEDLDNDGRKETARLRVLSSGFTTSPGLVYQLVTTTGASPKIWVDPGLGDGDTVDVAVDLWRISSVTGLPEKITAADASNTLFDVETQFQFAVTQATSTIDIFSAVQPRYTFVEEGAADDVLTSANDTDLTASAATFTWTVNPDVEDAIAPSIHADEATMSFASVSGSLQSAITGVFAEFGTATADDADVNLLAAPPIDVKANLDSTVTDDVVITVNGTEVIVTDDFELGLDVVFLSGFGGSNKSGQPRSGTTLSYGPEASHTWRPNGAQFLVPYVNLDTTNYETFIIVTNTSSADAEVWVDLVTDQGNNVTGFQLPSSAPANQTTMYKFEDIRAAMDAAGYTFTGGPGGLSERGALWFTVAAHPTKVRATAMQMNVLGSPIKRYVPVLTPEEGEQAGWWKN
ncbi:hypothetical protein [Deferrisoma palaeochoriense]